MEQLIGVFGLDWKLFLAQVVNFAVLLGVLSYFLYRPVMKALTDRAERIAQGLKDAEAAHQEREAVGAERAGIIKEAHHQAETIAARAEVDGKNERAAILKAAQERAAQVLKDAELAAAETERAALRASEAEIARSAILAAEKILKTNT